MKTPKLSFLVCTSVSLSLTSLISISCSSEIEKTARRGSTGKLFGGPTKKSESSTIEKSTTSSQAPGSESHSDDATAAKVDGIDVKIVSAEDPALVYSETVWPVVTEHCVGCHGQNTAPTFAAPDPSAAFTAVTFAKKINPDSPEKSRLVLRLVTEKHNCWSECEADGKVMENAIKAWANRTANITGSDLRIVTTAAKRLSDGVTPPPTVVAPPGVYALEAEDAALSGAMITSNVPGSLGGKVILTPNGSGAADTVNNANNSTDIARWKVSIKEAGNYMLFGRGSGPTAADDEFHVKIDNGAFVTWRLTATPDAKTFVWGRAPGNAVNLTPGEHTIELRRREAGASLDALALSTNPNFQGVDAVPPPPLPPMITYDLKGVCGDVSGATLTVGVDNFSPDAYKLLAPTIKTGDKGLRVKGLHLLLNGAESPQFATFKLVDTTVPANTETSLNAASMIVVKDAGPEADEFSFRLDECTIVP
jgi:hypothetical protein